MDKLKEFLDSAEARANQVVAAVNLLEYINAGASDLNEHVDHIATVIIALQSLSQVLLEEVELAQDTLKEASA